MGNGMNKIIGGVYVGNFRDSKDIDQLTKNNITHILSIHDNAKALREDREYLCIVASDTPEQSLVEFFPECIDFIHKARLSGGNVLIHCLAGVSRSVTVTGAYLMTATKLGWRDALNCIRGARNCAQPNYGFQKQLQEYENENLEKARAEFKAKYPDSPFDDARDCEINLKSYRHFLSTGETSPGPELYALPHRAYGDRKRGNNSSTNLVNKGEINEKLGDSPVNKESNSGNIDMNKEGKTCSDNLDGISQEKGSHSGNEDAFKGDKCDKSEESDGLSVLKGKIECACVSGENCECENS
ncbi:dual specificity protein phosphatase 22-like [Mya arenaria]|uniref:dual specificity protein phosphatase 22-like n=1 Tax=Mya arenaria TaxID=6604 RepID=UPI0022E16D7F|nr:dual specificity protein phosphatase 22-like [Mya arenaria]